MSASTTGNALHTYLNDHLSGALAALHLIESLLGDAADPERGLLEKLRDDIAEDRATLERLVDQIQGRESMLRQAGGWLAERAGRLKLLFDDPSRESLAKLEALEILALGIHGKRALWRALAAASIPAFRGFDFQSLERRARDQHDRVDARRLEVARDVLAAS